MKIKENKTKKTKQNEKRQIQSEINTMKIT